MATRKNVRDLQPDDMVRWEGGDEVVDSCVPSPSDPHVFQLTFVGWSRYVAVPCGGVYTILN